MSLVPLHLLDRMVFGPPYRRAAAAVAAFLSLVLPSSCVLCGRWDTSLCPDCLAAFRRATSRPFRAEAGAESLPDVELPGVESPDVELPDAEPPDAEPPGVEPPGVHQPTTTGAHVEPGSALGPALRARPNARPHARTTPPSFGPLPVIAAGRYGRAVSGILLAYKNHGHVDIGSPVAAALAGALHHGIADLAGTQASAEHPVLLVPVPGRSSSRRRRGYDPLMLLLSRLDRADSLPAGTVLVPAVQQVPAITRLGTALARTSVRAVVRGGMATALAGWNGGQKGLGRRRRRTNVLFSMTAVERGRKRLAGRSCVIVDDVLTTGATINEVYRVLHSSGASVLGAVVVAATSPPAGCGRSDLPVRSPGSFSAAPEAPGRSIELPEVLEHGGVNKTDL
jgi:predicted amidophosphoribosyltransferase